MQTCIVTDRKIMGMRNVSLAREFLAHNARCFWMTIIIILIIAKPCFCKNPIDNPEIAKIIIDYKFWIHLEHYRRCPSPEMQTRIVTDRTVLDMWNLTLARQFSAHVHGVFWVDAINII